MIAVGETFDDARDASEEYAREHEVELVVDGEDQRIACGAGTLALEVTDAIAVGQLPAPVAAIIPVGNGALINGVASWLRATLPDCRVVGVQAEAAAAMARSFAAGRADRHRVRGHIRRRHRHARRDPERGVTACRPRRRDAACVRVRAS